MKERDQIHILPATGHATPRSEDMFCTGDHGHPIKLNTAYRKHIGLCTICDPNEPPPRWNARGKKRFKENDNG